MTFTFLGAFDPHYPRNSVIRKGLRQLGATVAECRASRRLKFWARYPILLLKLPFKVPRWTPSVPAGRGSRNAGPRILFVPEFGQKDVPLARFWSLLAAGKVVFDPLAARYETKIVDWKRKPADSPSAWWNLQIDRAAFAGADLILADTAAHKAYYCRMYGLDTAKVEVLPLGYDDEVFRPRPWLAPERAAAAGAHATFEVLFTGSFLPLHGTDVIIEAARILAGRDPSVRFTLIGSGQTREAARRLAEGYGLRNVDFAEWRALEELPARIAAADVSLGIFGRTEKAGRVVPHKLFQALGMGKPLITARTPAAEEFFVDREHLVFCDEPLAASLAEAVLELKSDVALRERIARGGQALVAEKHSPRATARRLMEIVEKHFGYPRTGR
jgi:glycosyltransferase involved in cell wall biosynthesis